MTIIKNIDTFPENIREGIKYRLFCGISFVKVSAWASRQGYKLGSSTVAEYCVDSLGIYRGQGNKISKRVSVSGCKSPLNAKILRNLTMRVDTNSAEIYRHDLGTDGRIMAEYKLAESKKILAKYTHTNYVDNTIF